MKLAGYGEGELGEGGFVPLLVTGEMRSGTTLMANFLNTQESCTVYADLLRSLFLEGKNLGLTDLGAPLSERGRNVLCSAVAAEGWKMGVETLEAIPRKEVHTWVGLYLLSLRALDPEGISRVIGTKITCEYRYAEALLEQGVRHVFCVRDPRDVLLSARNRFGRYNLFEYAESWRRSLLVGRRLADHKLCEMVLFEDLLTDGKRGEVVERLSNLLGVVLTEDPGALTIRRGTRFVSNTSFGDVSGMFDRHAGWRWKGHLDEPEVAFASHFFAREIESLGLEPYRSSPGQLAGLPTGYLKYRITRRFKDFLLAIYRRAFVQGR